MTSAPAIILVAICGRSVFVKIKGRADFTSSVDLKRLMTELWQRSFSHFIFDLRDCLTMDSTFLGVLSGIGLKFSEGRHVQVGTPLELLNPNARITETLENLGVVDLFSIRNCPESLDEKFEPLALDPNKSQVDITRTCLEAHKTLMDLQPANVSKFKDVAQFLADDLKRLEDSGNT